jgi:hypothetical protein
MEAVETNGRGDYLFSQSDEVIQCRGCEYKSFRTVFHDEENMYPINDREWEAPITIDYYPKYNPDFIEIENSYNIPDVVRAIYLETLLAIQAGALTLAGLGLRGTLEAVCNERQITGKSLDKRISSMATKKLITERDADRLHGIRFLGNDAAHQIKKPDETQISVALKVINHLIASLYLLEIDTHDRLDTAIRDPKEFINLLNMHLRNFNSGDEYPLAKYLGKSMRRLHEKQADLVSHLIAEINNGSYIKLTLGKVDTYAGSSETHQHFVVV